jgi:hypothetical protein
MKCDEELYNHDLIYRIAKFLLQLQEIGVEWYELDMIKRLEIDEQFVDDNLFIFNIASWKSLKGGKIISLKKGMKVDMDDK